MKQKTDLLVLYQALYQAVMPLKDAVMNQYSNIMNTDDYDPDSLPLSDVLDLASCVAAEVEWEKVKENAA